MAKKKAIKKISKKIQDTITTLHKDREIKEQSPVIAQPSTTLLVFTGVFKESERFGKMTGVRYIFTKDDYGMPKPLSVYNKDKEYLLAERGKGCARRQPEKLFMTLDEWNQELEEQRQINS